MRDRFHWARLLAFVTGLVSQELLLCNEYLAAENRILKTHLPSRLRLSDAERSTLAEIAKRLGRKALKDVARVAKPDTVPTGNAEVFEMMETTHLPATRLYVHFANRDLVSSVCVSLPRGCGIGELRGCYGSSSRDFGLTGALR
jgi:hypothetical protein